MRRSILSADKFVHQKGFSFFGTTVRSQLSQEVMGVTDRGDNRLRQGAIYWWATNDFLIIPVIPSQSVVLWYSASSCEHQSAAREVEDGTISRFNFRTARMPSIQEHVHPFIFLCLLGKTRALLSTKPPALNEISILYQVCQSSLKSESLLFCVALLKVKSQKS